MRGHPRRIQAFRHRQTAGTRLERIPLPPEQDGLMSFVNPYFLFALAGVAVPVLIHLLTRDRIQHAPFSTLRFFARGAKLVVRRKKFRELLLLLLRVALAALLALAF